MEIRILGIDLSKAVFQLHGVNAQSRPVLQRRVERRHLLKTLAQLPACLIGLEACGSAHYWAREFQKLGHEVKLIAPQFVKPYVKTNKNDAADAEAICEALSRANMRFVPIKTVEQQDLQALHRVRERLVRHRVALSNEIRGLLAEYGVIFPKGRKGFQGVSPWLEPTSGLSDSFRETLGSLWTEYQGLCKQILSYEKRLNEIHRQSEVCQRLTKVPGVGVLTATALIASVGLGRQFKNGRQMAAYLGLVPRQHSSGGKSVLLGISKRGDGYLRKLLVHGARSTLRFVAHKKDARSVWVKEKIKTRGVNRACVALANRNARVLWVLLAKNETYRQVA